MIVTIHQPEHLPWTGFFHKMAQADIYVLLDIVQFTKNNWQNRNKLVDPNGREFWATVPVLLKGHTSTTIRDIRIDNSQDWRRKYWARIEDAYRKHPFFNRYAREVHEIVMEPFDRLVAFNSRLIDFFRKALGIRNRLLMASDLRPSGKRSELLLDICRKLGAATYLSGPSGQDYLKKEIFQEAGVEIQYHSFAAPVYPAPRFVPCLSTLDLLFNHGPESSQLIGI